MKKFAPVFLACAAFPSLATIHMEQFIVDGTVHHSYLAEVKGEPDATDWWERDDARRGAYEVGVRNAAGGQSSSGIIFWEAPQYTTHAAAREWMNNLSVANRKIITDWIHKEWVKPGESALDYPLWVRFRTSAKWTGGNFYYWSPPTETSDAAPWLPPQSCVIRVDVGDPVTGASLDDGVKWPVKTSRQCEYNGAGFRADDVQVMAGSDPDIKLEHIVSTPQLISWYAVLRPITSVGEISKSLVLRIEWP